MAWVYTILRVVRGCRHSQMLVKICSYPFVDALQIRKSVRKGLKDIIDKVGVTSIIVTHDQEEAFDLADQIVIFNR